MRTIALCEICHILHFRGLPTGKMVTELPCMVTEKEVQTVYKNHNSVKNVCVLNTFDINQTFLFELNVDC